MPCRYASRHRPERRAKEIAPETQILARPPPPRTHKLIERLMQYRRRILVLQAVGEPLDVLQLGRAGQPPRPHAERPYEFQ